MLLRLGIVLFSAIGAGGCCIVYPDKDVTPQAASFHGGYQIERDYRLKRDLYMVSSKADETRLTTVLVSQSDLSSTSGVSTLVPAGTIFQVKKLISVCHEPMGFGYILHFISPLGVIQNGPNAGTWIGLQHISTNEIINGQSQSSLVYVPDNKFVELVPPHE